ncbi:MAG: choice-of-anchor V domain-containing protein [Bacteroidota bacterium]|jgi:hypothetical protein
MKKNIHTALIAFSAFIFLASFNEGSFGKRRDGTDAGYTGSPGDSLKNCTACHGGAAMTVEGWVTSNVPAEGYTPGQRYRIRARNLYLGHDRFGFSASPQHPDGRLLGSMIITDSLRTKLIGNDKYITYRSAGVDGVDSNVWEFDWIAPPAGTRDVIFFAAFNSNLMGHKWSDATYLSTLRVLEKGTTSTNELGLKSVHIFPNPAKDFIQIDVPVWAVTSPVIAELYSINGQLLLHENIGINNRLDLETLALSKGVYLIKIMSGTNLVVKKVFIE